MYFDDVLNQFLPLLSVLDCSCQMIRAKLKQMVSNHMFGNLEDRTQKLDSTDKVFRRWIFLGCVEPDIGR